MKTNIYKALLLSLTLGSAVTIHAENGPGFNELIPEYDSIRKLPIDGMSVIEIGGRLVYASTNGRFIFTEATLYDTFNRRYLKSPQDISEYASKINIDAMGLDRSLIGAVNVGTGKKVVTVIVDPLCGYCASLLSAFISNTTLRAEYTLSVVAIPLLGPESGAILKSLICAREKKEITSEQYVSALANKDYETLRPSPESCDDGDVERAVLTAKMLGAKGVPFLISHDGRYMNAMPQDLAAFLSAGDSQ